MAFVKRGNLMIFLLLDLFTLALPQAGYRLPFYLIDSDHLTTSAQVLCLIAKLLPLLVIVGLDEELKEGYRLNYFIRNKNRNIFWTKSYLQSSALVLAAFLICTGTQLLVVQRWQPAWLFNLVLLAIICVAWQFVQRLIEFYSNSALALIASIGFFIFGIYNRVPALQNIRFLFGYLPAHQHYPAVTCLILLLTAALIWYLIQHFTKTRKMI